MTILIIPLYTLTGFFPFLSGSKLIYSIIVIAYIYLNHLLIRTNRRSTFFLYNIIFLIYALYMLIIDQYVFFKDVNFYSYVLIITFSLLFLSPNIIEEYYSFFMSHKKEFIYSICLFFVFIFISVVTGVGYRYNLDDKMWMLFGPFSLPHILGYELLVIYCGVSLYDKENKSLFFLIIKGLILIMTVLSGVRSAALALSLLVIYDYISMKNKSQKKTIFVIGIIVLIVIAKQTDFLLNNPLINKTRIAYDHGSVTSGREWYRKAQLDAFVHKSNFIQKLFGVGIPGVIEYMYQSLGVRIQGHNDYINTLVGYGIIGFVLLIINQLNLSKVSNSVWSKIFLQVFIFLLAYYNGFILYIVFVVSLPIVLCFFKEKQVGKRKRLFYVKRI